MKYLLLLQLFYFHSMVCGQELPGLVFYSKMQNSCELIDEINPNPANGAMIDISLTNNRDNVPNTALAFDNNSSYITLGAVSKLKITGDKSISFHIKPVITGTNRTGNIFSYGNGITIGYQEQASVAKLNIRFGTVLYFQTNLINDWQSVTITFLKDYSLSKSQASLYIDGMPQLQIQQDKTSADFENAIAISGPANQALPANGFRGSLDELKIYDRTLTAAEILNAALPVTLEFFTGKRTDGVVHLAWRTSIEDNVSHFNLQKSKDGITFQVITKVLAGKYDYEAIDNEPGDTDTWYRLQIVDKDGKMELSKTLKIAADSLLESGLTIYPNPATDALNFRGLDATDIVKIISVDGSLIKQQQGASKVSIISIRPGLYYVFVYDAGGHKKIVSKFIKRNNP